MTEIVKTNPKLVYVASDDLALAYTVSTLSKPEEIKWQERLSEQDLHAIDDELDRGHYSVLEFTCVELAVQDLPNIDLLYLSSFSNASIMKRSFRRVDHRAFCLGENITNHGLSKLLADYVLRLYRFASEQRANSWSTGLENILPLCSTVDVIMKTNLREFLEMYCIQDKLPGSLAGVIRETLERLNPGARRIIEKFGQTKTEGYIKDRMLSGSHFDSTQDGLIYDNCGQDIPPKDVFFVFRTKASFKLITQIIRERRLGIELDLDSTKTIDYCLFDEELRALEPREFRGIFSELYDACGPKEALCILPFATAVDSRITIPMEKLRGNFFGKLGANEPLASFAKQILKSLREKYPALVKIENWGL